jgi:hypothetical protein
LIISRSPDRQYPTWVRNKGLLNQNIAYGSAFDS